MENFRPVYDDQDVQIYYNTRYFAMNQSGKLDTHLIVICRRGMLQGEYSNKKFALEKDEILFISPGISLSQVMLSADFECIVLRISSTMMNTFLHNNSNLWNRTVYINNVNKYHLDSFSMQFTDKFHELLSMLINNEDDGFIHSDLGHDMIHSLLKSSILGLCYVMSVRSNNFDNPVDKKHQPTVFFNKFLALLQGRRIKHCKVEEYASELFITPKYLTVLCKRVSGKTANEWIREYTLADITYYLDNTNLSIKEISHRMGFESPSFFGKYVKQYLGCTPQQYRERTE